MNAALDPATPYPYLLYTLAGAAVVCIAVPKALNAVSQLERDAFRAHPQSQAMLYLVMWLLWPIIGALLFVEAVCNVILWGLDRWGGGK